MERRDSGSGMVPVLSLDRLHVPPGEHLCITGPSGAGKTTLVEVLCGLRRPGQGRLIVDGRSMFDVPGAALEQWRREKIGIVFQDFHLVPELGIEANILLPLSFAQFRVTPGQRVRARRLMDLMGLGDGKRRVAALSRGEQQRIGVARALLREPVLIVADEPTASLDAQTGGEVMGLLIDQARVTGASLVVVSHDPAVQACADRRVALAGGMVVEA